MATPSTPRFLSLLDVAEILNISESQVRALLRRGELRGIKIGGRGEWRVEVTELERYIEEAYRSTEEFIEQHPYEPELESDLHD